LTDELSDSHTTPTAFEQKFEQKFVFSECLLKKNKKEKVTKTQLIADVLVGSDFQGHSRSVIFISSGMAYATFY